MANIFFAKYYIGSMNENPLISVIIPVYNVEQYVECCLRSVMVQTYKNLEIIVVDDGSTDNSGRICDKIAKEDNRIRLVHQHNKGVSVARNIGMELAQGSYIGFVDPDDFICSDMYEYLFRIMMENKADISICSYKKFTFKHSIENIEDQDKVFCLDGYSALLELFNRSGIIKPSIWDGLYKKELLVQFPVGFICEDREFKVKVLVHSHIIAVGTKIKYFYRVRTDSLTRRKAGYQRLVKDFSIISARIENFIKSQEMELSILNAFYVSTLRFSANLLSKTAKYRLINCLPEARALISYYAPLVYTDKKKWRAYLICCLMKIKSIWPYISFFTVSDFVFGLYKKVYKKK